MSIIIILLLYNYHCYILIHVKSILWKSNSKRYNRNFRKIVGEFSVNLPQTLGILIWISVWKFIVIYFKPIKYTWGRAYITSIRKYFSILNQRVTSISYKYYELKSHECYVMLTDQSFAIPILNFTLCFFLSRIGGKDRIVTANARIRPNAVGTFNEVVSGEVYIAQEVSSRFSSIAFTCIVVEWLKICSDKWRF